MARAVECPAQVDKCRYLWIDWGLHARTHTLAQRLGIDLIEICIGGSRTLRYIRSMLQTHEVIRKKQPSVVIATNPSIVLGYLLLILRIVYGFRFISDAHYAGVQALMGGNIAQKVLDFHNTSADFVIVTNEGHARRLGSLGARTYVCPDPLPNIPKCDAMLRLLPGRPALLISSFDVDEPYEAVFEAFEPLQKHDYTLYVSGDYRKANIDLSKFPWVRFLGFIPDQDYYGYLRSCSLIIDLTNLEDCLVCGAYEALALEKPLILSHTTALRAYFGGACMFTENSVDAIRQCVQDAYQRRSELAELARRWVAENTRYMDGVIVGLRTELSTIS